MQPSPYKTVADTIVQSVLSNTGFISPIAETIGKMVDIAVHEYRLFDMENK